jgi:hypothetical protein
MQCLKIWNPVPSDKPEDLLLPTNVDNRGMYIEYLLAMLWILGFFWGGGEGRSDFVFNFGSTSGFCYCLQWTSTQPRYVHGRQCCESCKPTPPPSPPNLNSFFTENFKNPRCQNFLSVDIFPTRGGDWREQGEGELSQGSGLEAYLPGY